VAQVEVPHARIMTCPPRPRSGLLPCSRLGVRADGISVVLSGNRSKGTFTATLLLGGTLSGSFSC